MRHLLSLRQIMEEEEVDLDSVYLDPDDLVEIEADEEAGEED